MTLAEMIRNANGAEIYCVLDGCSDSAEIGLYQRTPDDFDEDIILDWPDDWPSWVSTKFIREQGLDVITA